MAWAVTTKYRGSSTTKNIVERRFDEVKSYAEDSLEHVEIYMNNLEDLLASLVVTSTDDIEDIAIGSPPSLDYAAIPTFSELLADFPTFDREPLVAPTMDEVPDITGYVPSRTFNFISNIPSKPDVHYGSAPEEPPLSSVIIPDKPTFTIPSAPSLDDLTVPAAPNIDIAKFDAILQPIQLPSDPTEFSFTEAPYNSDIRLPLFSKILDDIANGGTGLDVSVEQDIYDRFLARQIAENDRLFQEVQDQFSATGFSLPSGAMASRLLQVSSEISTKNDQASREIAINQAELAQKNTHFTIEQASILERMLVDFFNNQQNRALQAQQILATNAIEIHNAIVSRQNLLLEEYKTEAQVFEAKIRAEMAAIEIYRAEIEGVKAAADIQQAKVAIYTAQLGAIDTMVKVYQTEMESAKIQAEIQNLYIDLFKTKTEAYTTQIQAELTKVELYRAEVQAEGTRVDAFRAEVQAYEAEVQGKLGVIEAERIKAANKIATNQQKIDAYRADIDKYRSEIEAEIKTANLAVNGYQANVAAFQAQTSAKEMEFKVKIAEVSSQIEVARAKMEKARAMLEASSNSYVAVKTLQAKGVEGIMNANAQLAASAMNAVNASAGLSDGFSGSMGVSHNHSYNYEME
jgi:hypothetical protein